MKRTYLLFLALATLISGCQDQLIEKTTYKANVPEYISHESVDELTKSMPAREIKEPGKIFYYNNYLFVSERGTGVHIIDNSSPSSPTKVAFLQVPGNVDIAIKDDHLYADRFKDLLVFNVSDPANPTLTDTRKNVFDQAYLMPGYDPQYPVAEIDESKGYVIGWHVDEVTDVCKNDDCGYNRRFFTEPGVTFETNTTTAQFNAVSNGGSGSKSGGDQGIGKAGSMARFLVHGDHFYAIDGESTMQHFTISNGSLSGSSQTVRLGRNIETLFSRDDHLFVGAQAGMYIYDISDPANPSYVSEFNHARACDPVVVTGDYAYVTLRSGNSCGGWENQMDIIDISDISNPELKNTIQLNEPYGLGVDGNKEILFVCDGPHGLKVYDSTDPENPEEIETFSGINAYDVIPLSGLLILSSKDGIYQYSYVSKSNVQELSKIAVSEGGPS